MGTGGAGTTTTMRTAFGIMDTIGNMHAETGGTGTTTIKAGFVTSECDLLRDRHSVSCSL